MVMLFIKCLQEYIFQNLMHELKFFVKIQINH